MLTLLMRNWYLCITHLSSFSSPCPPSPLSLHLLVSFPFAKDLFLYFLFSMRIIICPFKNLTSNLIALWSQNMGYVKTYFLECEICFMAWYVISFKNVCMFLKRMCLWIFLFQFVLIFLLHFNALLLKNYPWLFPTETKCIFSLLWVSLFFMVPHSSPTGLAALMTSHSVCLDDFVLSG